MYIQNKLFKEYFILQYLFFFIIIVIPQLFFYEDLWDGTIYNYAQEINEFDGAKLQLYEPGWALNYWFIISIIKIANLLNAEYYSLYIFLLCIFYLLFLREVKIFIKKFIFQDETLIANTLLLVSIFSIQSYYFSSIMLWHLFCQISILYGIRSFNSSNRSNLLISLIFLFVGFSFKSALLYIFVIALYYNEDKIFTKKYLFLVLYGISIFFFFHYYLDNSGRSESYAQILNFLDPNNFFIFFKTFLTYLTFAMPISFLIFFFLINIFLNNKITQLKESYKFFLIKLFRFIWLNKNLFLLLAASIIPYITIGRNHVIWDVEDWAGRSAILLILPISIISIGLIDYFYNLKIISKKISIISIIFLFVINLSYLSKGSLFKINRIIYQKELSKLIQKNVEIFNNQDGILVIVDSYKVKPIFRINEINYLTYKSIGKNNFWAIFQNELDEKSIKYPKDKKYKNLYSSNFYSDKNIQNHCLIVMNFSSKGFENLSDKILNIFSKNYYEIKLNEIKKKNCKTND